MDARAFRFDENDDAATCKREERRRVKGEARLSSPFTPRAKLVSILEETKEGNDHEGRYSGEEGAGSSDAETSVEEATEQAIVEKRDQRKSNRSSNERYLRESSSEHTSAEIVSGLWAEQARSAPPKKRRVETQS